MLLKTYYITVVLLLCPVIILNALPTEKPTQNVKETKEIQNSGTSWGITWSPYNIAAVTTAILVVSAGIAGLTALFFPVFVYKICYSLGGCQNTMDAYVDNLIGVEGTTRKINKRSTDYLSPALSLLYRAYEKYGDQPDEEVRGHSVHKRSMKYIEPLFEILSQAVDEYVVSDEPKKNSKRGGSSER